MPGTPGRPKKGRRFGGDAAHQKAMLGNLVASLIAGEGLVTTETKAKALRPVFEKCVTKSKKGGVDRHRQVVAFIRDKDMAHKLFAEVAPRYADRNGGYTRILKLGPRHGDNAPMARIELVGPAPPGGARAARAGPAPGPGGGCLLGDAFPWLRPPARCAHRGGVVGSGPAAGPQPPGRGCLRRPD